MIAGEPRLPCPACLGVMMAKFKPVRGEDLVLDMCGRCGGIWFDRGEVEALRRAHPKSVDRVVELRETAHRMPCHRCHVPMDRNADTCEACGWNNRLACPTCDRQLERVARENLVLDVCRHCQGVWIDNHELADVWNLEVRRHLPDRPRDGAVVAADYFLLDAVLWAPDLVYLSAHGVAHGIGAVAGSMDGVADVAGAAAEGVGEVAGSVFETLADIISGLF